MIGAAIGTASGLYSASQELSVEWGVPQEQIRVGVYVLVLALNGAITGYSLGAVIRISD